MFNTVRKSWTFMYPDEWNQASSVKNTECKTLRWLWMDCLNQRQSSNHFEESPCTPEKRYDFILYVRTVLWVVVLVNSNCFAAHESMCSDFLRIDRWHTRHSFQWWLKICHFFLNITYRVIILKSIDCLFNSRGVGHWHVCKCISEPILRSQIGMSTKMMFI